MMLRGSRSIAVLLLLLGLANFCWCQEQPLTNLTLMKSLGANQLADSYIYYQLKFNATKRMLLLTLDMDRSTLVSIFLSVRYSGSNEVYYTHPNETYHTQECDQSSFETCVIRFDNYSKKQTEVTVYFSVYAFADVSYNLWAVVDDIYEPNINYKYRLDFALYQSGLLSVSGKQLMNKEEVVMVLSYNTSGTVGMFKAEAAVDQIPNSQGCCDVRHYGVTVGAFNKVMKLPPIGANQTYYILIEGQKGTKFNLYFYDSTPSAPSLEMNSSVIYYTLEDMSYSAYTTFGNIELPLLIQLNAFYGYGVFHVNYCNGYFKTTFQNLNGENQQIVIPPEQRLECKQMMMSKGASFGLLVESIAIEISNVNDFGFEIELYEGKHDTTLRLGEQKYGVFLSNYEKRSFPIEIVQFKAEVSVRYEQITSSEMNLLFEVEKCTTKRSKLQCKILQSNAGEKSGAMAFTPQPNHNYNLVVSLPEANSSALVQKLEFILELEHEYQAVMSISPFRLYLQKIEENQYNFYRINLTQVADQQKIRVQNNSQMIIKVREINGDIYTLMSFTIPEPTYEKFKDLNFTQQISFSWSGRIELVVNQTIELIYLAVRGNAESLYNLQYTLNVDADIPAKYSKITEGMQNNFLLDKNTPYQLFSFTSHILPYKLYITNTPKCIKMGFSLPLNQTCLSEIPSQFKNKVVYFNVSNGNSHLFKFSVFVNSGEYVLDDSDSLLLGCTDSCYEVVNVMLKKAGNVIHEGRGQIYPVSRPTEVVYNSFLALSCEVYPCVVKINATLPYGGEMTLFLQQSGIKQIQWRAIPITFGDYPKKFLYELRPWAEINSILVYSQALQLQIYYNIINIHESEANIKSYTFPTPLDFDGNHSGNPLRKTQAIVISDDLIKSKGCKNSNSYCIVAIALYPNLRVQYNEDYFFGGVGYISANTFLYYFPINTFYTMEEQFSLSHFVHRRTPDQIFSQKGYRIQIEPESNCHPTIYVPDSVPYRPNYNDIVVNYRYGWINFSVLAEGQCKYRIALTNSLYTLVGQNRYYLLKAEGGLVTVLYRSEYDSQMGFRIEAQNNSPYNKISYIAANKVNEELGIVLPSPAKADFQSSSNSLTIAEDQTSHLYVIVIRVLGGSQQQTVNLIIRKGSFVFLTHNQEQVQTLGGQRTLSYKFSTTGSIVLFITTSRQYITVTVNKNYNRTEVKRTMLSPRSQPWVVINASSNELVTYDLTILNTGMNQTDVNIMYQENDMLAYERLYEGIVTYDAFCQANQRNCYVVRTPMMVGRKSFKIDFVVGRNNSLMGCSREQQCLSLLYTATTEGSTISSELHLIHSDFPTYRLTIDFLPAHNYTICFYSPNDTVVNMEYYLLLHDPGMRHLVENHFHVQIVESQYDMFEIVEEGFNELIMIELTNCFGDQDNQRTLVGSASFLEAELGRYTDLVNYHKTESSIYAQLQVSEGYYYLGVKNELDSDRDANYLSGYAIKYQNITDSSAMLPPVWKLRDTRIVKIYKAFDNQSIFRIELPEIVNTDDDVHQSNITITYKVLIQESGNMSTGGGLPLEVGLRCPGYKPFSLPMGKQQSSVLTKSASLVFTYDNQSHFSQTRKTPIFSFSALELPTEFNITGKIEILSSGQSFSFYYDNSKANLNHLETGGGMSGGVIAFIVIIVIIMLAIVGYVIWTYAALKRKDRKEQALEMLNVSNAESKAREQPEVSKNSGKGQEKGYGQLVDELN